MSCIAWNVSKDLEFDAPRKENQTLSNALYTQASKRSEKIRLSLQLWGSLYLLQERRCSPGPHISHMAILSWCGP